MAGNPSNSAGEIVNLKSLTDDQLIQLRAKLEIEMKDRRLAFSIGEIGETLVIQHYNNTPGLPALQPARPGTKNVDAISNDGERYSIKTIWKAKKTGTIYPDSEQRNKQLFEFLLIVELDEELSLKSIYKFSWKDFTEVRSWDSRMNAWYMSCSKRTLTQGENMLPMEH